ncbi:rhodanese-like domain-containing protein [Sorangium sp. So ce1024]|uniref:rhodanese-like domain-containing protein n=1 Tax=unclassified Sorangium TaxID=2621164 RepID=UPI003F0C42C7
MAISEFQKIGAEEALRQIFSHFEQDRDYSLFDVRDAHSYGHGHIPTAQLLHEREVGTWIGKLPRTQPVFIYCHQGFSSQTFAKTFADFGFREVYSVEGGFPALVKALRQARDAAHAAKAG